MTEQYVTLGPDVANFWDGEQTEGNRKLLVGQIRKMSLTHRVKLAILNGALQIVADPTPEQIAASVPPPLVLNPATNTTTPGAIDVNAIVAALLNDQAPSDKTFYSSLKVESMRALSRAEISLQSYRIEAVEFLLSSNAGNFERVKQVIDFIHANAGILDKISTSKADRVEFEALRENVSAYHVVTDAAMESIRQTINKQITEFTGNLELLWSQLQTDNTQTVGIIHSLSAVVEFNRNTSYQALKALEVSTQAAIDLNDKTFLYRLQSFFNETNNRFSILQDDNAKYDAAIYTEIEILGEQLAKQERTTDQQIGLLSINFDALEKEVLRDQATKDALITSMATAITALSSSLSSYRKFSDEEFASLSKALTTLSALVATNRQASDAGINTLSATVTANRQATDAGLSSLSTTVTSNRQAADASASTLNAAVTALSNTVLVNKQASDASATALTAQKTAIDAQMAVVSADIRRTETIDPANVTATQNLTGTAGMDKLGIWTTTINQTIGYNGAAAKGDRLTLQIYLDSSLLGLTITFSSTKFKANGTVTASLGAKKYAVLQFIFNGSLFIECSRTVM